MNIVMVGPARSVHGGISGVVNNLCEAGLDKRINLIYIATMSEGSKIHKLMMAVKGYLAFLKEVKHAEVVHVHVASDSSFYRKAMFIKAAAKRNKRIVIHQHGGDFINYYNNVMNDKRKGYAREIFSMADRLIVLTPEYESFFEQLLPDMKNKLVLLPNTVKIPDQNDKAMLEAGIENIKMRKLLFLGRICKTKGMTELLEAIKILKEEYPDICLYLGGIYEDETYKTKVDELGENVRFLGWIGGKDKEKYLSECGMFVLPTYFEGQPVSVLEAMAYHCTVVATGVGGIPMMIQDGKNGVLVEPKNVDSLVEGIRRLLHDPELAVRLSDQAYEDVKNNYSIDKSVNTLILLYEELKSV